MGYFAFPWEQIGTVLRRLSLAGGAGNAAAWVMYGVMGGCPLFLWGLFARQGKSSRADLLLPVLSLTLFSGLWFLINPSYLEAGFFPAGMKEAGKGAFALSIDSVLLCWLLLRFLDNSGKMSRKSLLRSLELMLGLYVALAGAAVLVQAGAELGEGWKSTGVSQWGNGGPVLQGPDIMSGRSMGLSRCFLVLQTICRYLPECLELVICTGVVRFLHSCEQDSFQEESLRQVRRLKKLSACSIGVVTGANVCVNLLQLTFAGYIYSSSYALVFPVRQIIFMMGVLILSGFWLEGKELKDDNGLFI
ncbi:MAG: hypothetical protein NC123_12500 [Butyrivibrio sp.]|nr:hypothetical protein [Acetatifactor muris]MCM1560343.1 hypothetical protein [Butyrivibrio sp.]